MIVDYTHLNQPTIRLSLVRVGTGYIVWDQQCRYYILAPSPLAFCLKFLKAGADKGDWLIDDASVEMATWSAAQHSVRVGALDAGETVPPSWDVADGTSPASNVVPIRRLA